MASLGRVTALCLAGNTSRREIHEVAQEQGITVEHAQTVAQAVAMVQQRRYDFVISALGVDAATIIFDIAGDRSSLITAAKANQVRDRAAVIRAAEERKTL